MKLEWTEPALSDLESIRDYIPSYRIIYRVGTDSILILTVSYTRCSGFKSERTQTLGHHITRFFTSPINFFKKEEKGFNPK
ncbi:hypothetical protein C5S32_13185 [ANME-1 cluster archaeon GoMg1]|nr:hypothetical protein [ANME-1 cluster archaeon GoMg1]